MAVGEFEGMPATDEGVIKRRTLTMSPAALVTTGGEGAGLVLGDSFEIVDWAAANSRGALTPCLADPEFRALLDRFGAATRYTFHWDL